MATQIPDNATVLAALQKLNRVNVNRGSGDKGASAPAVAPPPAGVQDVVNLSKAASIATAAQSGKLNSEAVQPSDLSREAIRVQALQVQQQLKEQKLSIANQRPTELLGLFRGT
ncbi:MAG: hypothetical protein HYR63_07035 [Proteobacteria bacterium]|nr:hypothetical protein [Pseudomonadota bacterium]MBI3498743.1 hypothetical protein [Pseudomonadota bacterium]